MAYAAVVCLAEIVDQLLQSEPYDIEFPKPQLGSLYDKLCLLQSSLEEIFPAPKSRRREANDLEIRIRDAVYEAQDAIEFFISTHDRSCCPSILLEEIIAKLDPITTTAEMVGCSIRQSKLDPQPQAEDLMSENAMRSTSFGKTTTTVGLDEDLENIMVKLTEYSSSLRVVAITGMGGVGKTTLAGVVYNHPLVVEHFEIRGWITVSEEYRISDIVRGLLGSLTGSTERRGMSEDEMGLDLYKFLFARRYLIVMDDVWDEVLFDNVRRFLPGNDNGSRIVVTTRNVDVAKTLSSSHHHVVQPLDQEWSWELLREKVFGADQDCPHELENIGRSIAEKCGGIPLSIVVVAGLLSNSMKTVDYWQSIEEDVHLAAADATYFDILSLSYNNLPSRLKACFLYIGAFPKDSEIFVSKLIKLWVAEGFLTPPSSPSQTLEHVAHQHLKDLIGRNLIFVQRISDDGQVKACSMPGNLQRFAVEECQKEKFFHTITRYVATHLHTNIASQRRICVHKNTLMCAKDVYLHTKSITLARTLLYAGLDHLHPLPFCLTFDLLRVLDAFSVYFIELPNALFELIHLRYLALTFDEDLPPSISKLRNLLILIVRQHPKIIIRRPLILPKEIWNMSQIRHLLFTESVLSDPYTAQNSLLLENLQSLSNVNAACCTQEILQNMPNLKKLGIWIEAPGVLRLYLDQLPCLEALKFTVLKPNPEEKIHFQPELGFPRTLKKLSLSGCGIPWEDMSIIGQLPCLEVLKLRELAFQGPKWCPIEGEFFKLRFLLLESLDLVEWIADVPHFPQLERLIIRHCYELEEVSQSFGDIDTLQLIKLVHCSPPAVLSACLILDEQQSWGIEGCQLVFHSSREFEQRMKEELGDRYHDFLQYFSWE